MGIGKTIHKVIESRPNLVKTLWINLKVLSFKDAIRLPIVLYGPVELRGIKRGCIVFDMVATATLRIGGGGGFYGRVPRSHTLYHNMGKHIVHGRCNILNGGIIVIAHSGTLETGNRVSIGANVRLKCTDRIKIGNSCMVSWDVQIFDTDFHYVISDGKSIARNNKPVIINDFVWIGSRVTLLKGTIIPDGTIVSSNSLVNKDLIGGGERDLVIGGVPAKIIGNNKRRFMFEGEDLPSLIAADEKLNKLFSQDRSLVSIDAEELFNSKKGC